MLQEARKLPATFQEHEYSESGNERESRNRHDDNYRVLSAAAALRAGVFNCIKVVLWAARAAEGPARAGAAKNRVRHQRALQRRGFRLVLSKAW